MQMRSNYGAVLLHLFPFLAMSNYIKYYKHNSDKEKEATHQASFIDYKRKYSIFFKRIGSSTCRAGSMTMEEFGKFIKDYEEVNE